MRNFFLALALLAALALPAFAQHGGHNGGQRGGHNAGQRGGHEARGPQGTHNGSWGRERRYEGRRFENRYWRGHYGPGYRYGWGRTRWIGRPYFAGSRFFVGGYWFVLVEPVPVYWYGDPYYVEYDPHFGYVLVNPVYPGVYVGVNVIF
jgi:hypothetical protein